MATPENTFIQSVHRRLPRELYRIKNNNVFNSGQPDVWYSGKKADLWVEYKFIKVPVKDSTPIDLLSGKNPPLSYLQQEWLRMRCGEGRNVGLMVGSKDGGVWFPGVSWDGVYSTEEFRARLQTRAELGKIIENLIST